MCACVYVCCACNVYVCVHLTAFTTTLHLGAPHSRRASLLGVNPPFLREFNFCNVAQTVVDQVLDHVLPQMTLNILGKQSMSYLI